MRGAASAEEVPPRGHRGAEDSAGTEERGGVAGTEERRWHGP